MSNYNDFDKPRYKYPCEDCSEKYEGCHGKCERYLETKKKNDYINEIKKKEGLLNRRKIRREW